jgi:hypothetical protein
VTESLFPCFREAFARDPNEPFVKDVDAVLWGIELRMER